MCKTLINFFKDETWTVSFSLEKLKGALSLKSIESSPLPTMIFVAMNSMTACFSLVVLVEAQRILKEASVALREREEALAVRALELAAMEEKSFVTFHQAECLGLIVIGLGFFLLICIVGHPRIFPDAPDAPPPTSEIIIIYLDEKFWELIRITLKAGRKIAKVTQGFERQLEIWIKKVKREASSVEISNKVTQADSVTLVPEKGSSLPEITLTMEKVWMNEEIAPAMSIEALETAKYIKYGLTQMDILRPLPKLVSSIPLPELVFTIEKVSL